jgi:hypothetical protein
VPLRPNRTPKHPTDPTTTSSSSPVEPSLEIGRRVRRGVALTAVLAGAVVGATALSAESVDEPAVARTAATTDVVLPTPDPAELARLAESRSDERLSRSGGRGPDSAADPAKAQALRAEARPGPQESRTRTVELGDPREIAQAMLADYGWSSGEFSCLDSLWVKESGWDPQAANPTSSAYGIPQALPGSKMATAGADWETNPATQIEWGLGYISERYGSPCSAWSHSQANGWY